MIEEFEYEGEWWLPNKPKKQISGILRFTPNEGAILDLKNSFMDIIDIKKILYPEIILGISSDKKNITLHKCLQTVSNSFADEVFVGAHFQKKEDMKFKKLTIHYSNLDEWVDISGFEIQPLFDGKKVKGVVIKHTLPKSIQAAIGDGYKIFIDIQATYPILPIPVRKEASIKQRTYIRIEPSEEKSFDEYRDIMYHIRNFLSFGIGEPVYPLAIEGITEANKEIREDKTYYPPVKIFYKQSDIPKAPKTVYPFEMLFTFKDISDRFEVFLRNWFEKADLLEPVYDLYFGTLYNPRMFLEFQFLSLIHAIESFHRRRYGGKYLPEDDYEKVRDVLEKAIPDEVENDHKQSLESRIIYGNEFSLRKRLKKIFDKYQEYLFSWDNVPGNDNERLLRFLRDDLDIGWMENAEIRKSNDGNTLCIFKDEHAAEIVIDEKKEKASLKISDDRTLDLKVKKENGKLNIYENLLNKFIEKKDIECVVDTRNYLTHYEEDPEKCVVRGEDLYHLIQKLKILLEICLLTELGFSSEEIKKSFFKK